MKTASALLSTALFMASTAGAASGIKPAPPPPPYAGVYQPQGVDELGLWRESDEDERIFAGLLVMIAAGRCAYTSCANLRSMPP